MKKFAYIALGFSLAGAFLSGILAHQHFFGASKVSSFFCGGDITNPCQALSLTEYSVLLGIPVAVYGLFFYSIITGIVFTAAYAKGKYYHICVAIVLPLSGLGLAADLALFITLLSIKMFCTLCIFSYIAGIFLFITILMWYLNIIKTEKFSLPVLYRDVFSYYKRTPDTRAVLSFFILFAVFLAFSLVSFSHMMKKETSSRMVMLEETKKFVDEYNASPVESVNLPGSTMVAGNPDAELKIIVFTDFLCTFCHKFYLVEEYLLGRFKGRIKFEYHSYPLDQGCNKFVQRTVYNNSCVASAAMLSAAEMGIFEQYSAVHFNNYNKIKSIYDRNIAEMVFNSFGTVDVRDGFIKRLNSAEMAEKIQADIDLAVKNNIKSTPTIFIGNKRIVGARSKEVLETIIAGMLK